MNKTKFIIFLTLLLEARLLYIYSLPPLALVFFAITLIESILFVNSKKNLGIAGWWLYIYIFCSFLIISNFQFTPYRFTLSASGIKESDFIVMAETTIYAYAAYFTALLFFCKPTSIINTVNAKSNFSPHFNMFFTFSIAFIFTAISAVVGIGQMGVETTKLPFHLAGIIQFTRTDLIPVMALCIYAYNKTRGRSTKSMLIILFVWAIFEAFVRMSKSAILFCFLPIVMYEFITNSNNIKSTIRKFVPVLVVILVLYPVIETLRHTDSIQGAWKESNEEYTGTFASPNSVNPLVKPFNRQFLTGYLFVVDQSFVDKTTLFDFSKAPAILAGGGSGKYQTFVIDEYPEGVVHSSGTSPFIDSFLMGGYGLLFLSFFVLTWIAEVIDRLYRNKSNYLIVAVLLVGFYRLFDMALVTFFLNEMSIRYLVVYAGICFYINYQYKQNKKYLQ